MRTLTLAYGLSILSASIYLFSGLGWTELTAIDALLILGLEAVTALLAARIIALITMKAAVSGDRRPEVIAGLRSVLVGVALGPFAGAISLGTLVAISLGHGASDRLGGLSDGMIGVSRLYPLAGVVGGVTFWLIVRGRMARRERPA
jgi:hypothetical protein